MAEGVIEVLEMIDVDHQHGQWQLLAMREIDLARHRAVQRHAIEGTGQGVA